VRGLLGGENSPAAVVYRFFPNGLKDVRGR